MEVLYAMSAWQVALALFLLLVLTTESAYQLGRRRSRTMPARSTTASSMVPGAVLGLLGLLLAFSFSMAVTRYDLRKQAVRREANAVGTCYLRAGLLGDPATARMHDLLRTYVDVRLAYYEAGIDAAGLARVAAETECLQRALWTLVAGEAQRDPSPVGAALVVQSLNDVIAVSAEREAARQNQIPDVVLLLVFAGVLVSGIVVGYAFGHEERRNVLASLLFAVLVTLVVFTILDLDRPRRGLIHVSQQAMLTLRESLRRDAAR